MTPTEEDVARARLVVTTMSSTWDGSIDIIALALAVTREAERARCAKIADIYANTKPNLAQSDNPTTARTIAAIMADTGQKIAAAIRAPDQLPPYPPPPVSAVEAASRMRAQEQWEIDVPDNKKPRT